MSVVNVADVRLAQIVVTAANGAIGKDGKLPWHIAEELQLFKRVTMGGVLLMGRKTFESVGFVFPGRHSLVLTGQSDWKPQDHVKNWTPEKASRVDVCGSLEGALAVYVKIAGASKGEPAPKLFCIGGGQIYKLTQGICNEVHWSEVRSKSDKEWAPEADTYFDLNFLSEFDAQETHAVETAGDLAVTYSRLAKS